MVAVLAGCSAKPPEEPPVQAAEPGAQTALVNESVAPKGGVAGLWEGTSTASCLPLQPDAHRCNAVVKITLRIFQKGRDLSGDYTCGMGTTDCRNTDTTGVIADGALHGEGIGLRIMLPDGSSCLFNGRPSQNSMTGSYFCMQGGGYVEQGRFQVQRSY
jgi:hypothetical protein